MLNKSDRIRFSKLLHGEQSRILDHSEVFSEVEKLKNSWDLPLRHFCKIILGRQDAIYGKSTDDLISEVFSSDRDLYDHMNEYSEKAVSLLNGLEETGVALGVLGATESLGTVDADTFIRKMGTSIHILQTRAGTTNNVPKTIARIKRLLDLDKDNSYDDILNAIETMRKERDNLQATLNERLDGAVSPETRYIVHGDIKPCTVLYSDDTTTLVRFPDQDMMCETDTIEWSDELTYRCQELLRGGATTVHRISLPTIKRVAELVANGELHFDDSGADPVYFRRDASKQFEGFSDAVSAEQQDAANGGLSC